MVCKDSDFQGLQPREQECREGDMEINRDVQGMGCRVRVPGSKSCCWCEVWGVMRAETEEYRI